MNIRENLSISRAYVYVHNFDWNCEPNTSSDFHVWIVDKLIRKRMHCLVCAHQRLCYVRDENRLKTEAVHGEN